MRGVGFEPTSRSDGIWNHHVCQFHHSRKNRNQSVPQPPKNHEGFYAIGIPRKIRTLIYGFVAHHSILWAIETYKTFSRDRRSTCTLTHFLTLKRFPWLGTQISYEESLVSCWNTWASITHLKSHQIVFYFWITAPNKHNIKIKWSIRNTNTFLRRCDSPWFRLKGHHKTDWWKLWELNSWPIVCKTIVLPTELSPHIMLESSSPIQPWQSLRSIFTNAIVLTKTRRLNNKIMLIFFLSFCVT